MFSFSSVAFSTVSFSILAFALASSDAPPNLIQIPGLTSSSWTVMTPPPRKRPVEDDETMLVMGMI
jgi:hypothetical protein